MNLISCRGASGGLRGHAESWGHDSWGSPWMVGQSQCVTLGHPINGWRSPMGSQAITTCIVLGIGHYMNGWFRDFS